jgi:hypothetical protein
VLFSSESVDEVKEIKIRTANIIGKPSPLMMAPKELYKEHHKTSICNYKFIEKQVGGC